MKASTIRPGLLVSLKTSIRGGVEYQRLDIEPDHAEATGERVAKWETTRIIPDPAEYERANQTRSKARSTVTAVCCASSFGLLCPSEREADLNAAVDKARDIAQAHNNEAKLTRVDVFVLVGRVAQDDAEAVRAIGAEVRELLDAMQTGIKAADPEAIREAATKARALGAMLTEDAAGRVADAVNEARKAAREIVRRVEKSGEAAAAVVASLPLRSIEAARFAFLDLEAGTVTPEAPAARGLDLPRLDYGDGTSKPMNEAADMVAGNAAAMPQLALEV